MDQHHMSILLFYFLILIKLLFLIYSRVVIQIKMEEDSIESNSAWSKNTKAIIEPLQQIYAQMGISTSHVNQVKKSLNKFREHMKTLPNSNAYFENMEAIYEEKNFHRIVQKPTIFNILPDKYLDKIQGSIENPSLPMQQSQQMKKKKENIDLYRDMLYENHKNLIKYLTRHKFSFSHIAKHSYQTEQNSSYKTKQNSSSMSQTFSFDVQRGKQYGTGPNQWSCDNNILLFYLFVRDLCRAILELQKHHIFHMDLNRHNILLFNCPNTQILKDKKKFARILRKISFKLIDFGNAFLMNQSDMKSIINLKYQIDDKLTDPFYSYILSKSDNRAALSNLYQNYEAYQENHSIHVQTCIQDVMRHIKDQSQQFQNEVMLLKKMIEQKKYREVIWRVEQKISQQWNKMMKQ